MKMVLIILTVITLILAFKSIIVYLSFHIAASGMFFMTCVVMLIPIYNRRHFLKAVVGTIISIIGVFFLYLLLRIMVPREVHREYISPESTHTIVIEYDHASRPSVYLKYGIFMKR